MYTGAVIIGSQYIKEELTDNQKIKQNGQLINL